MSQEAPSIQPRNIGSTNSYPSQIGEALWRARTRCNLSIEDVARVTGVAAALLVSIEDSDFEGMRGAPTIAQAARSYAQAVGLPKEWVVRTLNGELWPKGKA